MNKKDFVRLVTDSLRKKNIRKEVSAPQFVIHISDDEGHKKDFNVPRLEKTAIYTVKDVEAIFDECLLMAEKSLSRGEPISIYRYGELRPQVRKARNTRIPGTDRFVDVEERYVPRLIFGKNMKAAARLYEMSLKADKQIQNEPDYIDEEDEEECL